jgi:hypothetical protein
LVQIRQSFGDLIDQSRLDSVDHVFVIAIERTVSVEHALRSPQRVQQRRFTVVPGKWIVVRRRAIQDHVDRRPPIFQVTESGAAPHAVGVGIQAIDPFDVLLQTQGLELR